jgi:hypothetical protein
LLEVRMSVGDALAVDDLGPHGERQGTACDNADAVGAAPFRARLCRRISRRRVMTRSLAPFSGRECRPMSEPRWAA